MIKVCVIGLWLTLVGCYEPPKPKIEVIENDTHRCWRINEYVPTPWTCSLKKTT